MIAMAGSKHGGHKRGRHRRRRRRERDDVEHAGLAGGRRREDEGAGGRDDVLARVGKGAKDAANHVKDGVATVAGQVRDAAGEITGSVLGTLLDEAERIYDEHREQAVSRVAGAGKLAGRLAHALRAVKAEGIASYAERAAEQADEATDYLDDRSLAEILEDVGELVRRHSEIAIAALFIGSFALTRFLKASQSRQAETAKGQHMSKTSMRHTKRNRGARWR